ncbi:putative inorganic diphosphatase [Medicago truncatula]|uniref:Putative inorganic diphosphatase n=1 Tax=Medicago truncatula TaxID=3880 RepID=A0A396JRD8_MEDTR|nr:putative inorganic diphosphatase [Medicago truncatula]
MFRVSGCCLLIITLKQTSDIKLSMKITTYVNARTTLEARKGKRKSSAVAFRSGCYYHSCRIIGSNGFRSSETRQIFHSNILIKLAVVESLVSGPLVFLQSTIPRQTYVMLIIKSHKVASKLVKAFTDHKVQKTYISLCTGQTPNWETITVRSCYGRSKFGTRRVYVFLRCRSWITGWISCPEVAELGFEVSDGVVVEEKAVKMEGADEGNEIVVNLS